VKIRTVVLVLFNKFQDAYLLPRVIFGGLTTFLFWQNLVLKNDAYQTENYQTFWYFDINNVLTDIKNQYTNK
jgi:hypothetical protein